VEALKLAYEQKLLFWQFFGFGFIESGASILAEHQSGSRGFDEQNLKKKNLRREWIDMPWMPILIRKDADPTRSGSGSTTLFFGE
jgi:hypothetical protein